MLDEAERSLHDALCVLSQTVLDSRVIYGGGWAEMQVGWGAVEAVGVWRRLALATRALADVQPHPSLASSFSMACVLRVLLVPPAPRAACGAQASCCATLRATC